MTLGTSPLINTARRKMLAGEPAIGVTLALGSPLAAEFLSRAGFDFVLVDNQHGAWDDDSTMVAFRYICLGSAIPMARVRQNDYYAIGRLLDRGAMGIVVPMVNTVEEARAAAFAVRYPPIGGRSMGATLASHYGSEYGQKIDQEVFLAVQIESVQAVENAEAILGVDGVDGCWIGPNDLARSMGVNWRSEDGGKVHREMIMRVRDACRKTGKICGISGEVDVSFWVENGLQFITASNDFMLMLEGAKEVWRKLGRQP
ncbi:MAG: aldolase/citrate lyase family protein [Chloroflexota bacterium]